MRVKFFMRGKEHYASVDGVEMPSQEVEAYTERIDAQTKAATVKATSVTLNGLGDGYKEFDGVKTPFKGNVQFNGLQRMPVTLYAGQLPTLSMMILDAARIVANPANATKLSFKGEQAAPTIAWAMGWIAAHAPAAK